MRFGSKKNNHHTNELIDRERNSVQKLSDSKLDEKKTVEYVEEKYERTGCMCFEFYW